MAQFDLPLALRLVSRALFVLSLCGLFGGLYLALEEMRSGRTLLAPGEIIGTEPGLRFSFTTADGTRLRVGTRLPARFHREGDRVTIAYDPLIPQDARVDGLTGRYFDAVLAFGFGLILAFAGATVAATGQRRAAPRR